MKPTTGLGLERVLLYFSRYSAASSSMPPPISPMRTIPAESSQSQFEQLAFAFEEVEAEDDAATQYMTSPIEDTIDWDSIEDCLMHDG